MRFEDFLGRGVRGFWATSYSFDLRLFDQYLLRRLAQSPLNATVLVDHDKLASVWEHLDDGQMYLARQIGRRYLVRGLRAPNGGAFHPKTYFFASADQAALLVGSGNLTRGGIDNGYEAFTSFSTLRNEDLPTIRSWSKWIGHLVQEQGDQLLKNHWAALRETVPKMLGTSEGSLFLTNITRPLSAQLAERIPGPVTELHVTAPFFDEDALALRQLISRCSPDRLTLYVGDGLSVNGSALKAALRTARDVRVRRFEPRRFVHAKLIGVVNQDGSGILLSGSPNLSSAALALTYDQPGGNCEVAVVRSGTGDQVRRIFEGSGLDLIDESVDWLTSFEFNDDHPKSSRPIALESAYWREDGRVQLQWSPSPLPVEARLCWDGASVTPAELTPDGATAEPLYEQDPLPVLVRLIDNVGETISNRVAVDDPAALRETLAGSASKGSGRPPEFEDIEMGPLVRLVLWAHDKFIFDPDQTAAFRRAQEAVVEESNAEDAGTFWERYADEELQYDPRRQSYRALSASGVGTQPVDELLRELQAMLLGAPATSAGRVMQALTGRDDGHIEPGGAGSPWSMQARQRIRAYHLLTRWANAVADPRHALVAATAPVTNYETLLGIILMAWINEAMEPRQLLQLLRTLLEAFVGPAQGHGFLGRISEDQRIAALASLDGAFVEIAAGLVYAALSRPAWTDDIYDWQPTVQRGIELGVTLPGALSESVLAHVVGKAVSVNEIDELLVNRSDWIDDSTWTKRLAKELHLSAVILERFTNPKVSLLAKISGSIDVLTDPRVLTVARRVVDFKQLSAVAVRVGADTFVFEPGAPARVRVGGSSGVGYQSDGPVDSNRLNEIETQGGTLSDLFGLQTRVEPAA
jgi:hypothetical protein